MLGPRQMVDYQYNGTKGRLAADRNNWLVGDIGATNARFGLVAPGGALLQLDTYPAPISRRSTRRSGPIWKRRDLPMPRLGRHRDRRRDHRRPIPHDQSSLELFGEGCATGSVSSGWSRSTTSPRSPWPSRCSARPIGCRSAAARRSRADDRGARPRFGAGRLGAGSGGAEWIALSGEGGHATMAPASERESAVLDLMRARLRPRLGRAVISGPGLVNLYDSLAALEGVPAAPYTPAQITDPEIGEQDRSAPRRPKCFARCSAPWPAIWR